MILLAPLAQAAAAAAAGSHPLSGTAARWLWAVPVLPLLGFLINGFLSLVAVYRPGPADPSAHHGDAHVGHEGVHAEHADAASHGHDDAHHVERHRFAGITTIAFQHSGIRSLEFT